ncbi:MAG: flagellar basal body P-ring formation chaperone FlgA [Pseudomonas sp.]|uniref:flagellar basal body P-ring formation chaperone FlgA n=1 Tax=Pseudomonas sp. TaxID=306 RepID=UPI003D0DC2A6
MRPPRLVVGLVAALLPGIAQAELSASQQIDQAVERHLAQAVASEAKAQGWTKTRFTHTSTSLNSTASLPPCTQPLTVSPSDAGASLLARQRLDVRCADQPGWAVVVSSQASVFLPAVFSSQAIERGQTIGASQLTLQELEIGKASRGFFTDLDEVAGMGAKRRIRPNQALSPGLLTTPLLIKRGQQVKIMASHDGIEASTMGEALENGGLKAVIRVRNLSSGKTIEAKVLDKGVVSSTFR